MLAGYQVNTALVAATIGLVISCIAAASLSEIAVLYFGDSIIVRGSMFFGVLALLHATLIAVISKILGKRGTTINR